MQDDKSSDNITENGASNLNRSPESSKSKKAVKTAAVICAVVIILILIFFAGKNLAVNRLKKAVNENIRGQLNIESVDLGLKKIELRGISLEDKSGNTPIRVKRIVIKYKPLRILQKPPGQKAIQSIDVHNPMVKLRIDSKGKLNLNELFIKKEKIGKAPELGIEAPLRIHGGEVTFTDLRGKTTKKVAVPISAEIILKGNLGGQIKSLNITVDKSTKIIATGKIHPEFAGVDLHFEAENINPAQWSGYLFTGDQARILEGTVDVDGYISLPGGEKEIQGEEIPKKQGNRKEIIKTAWVDERDEGKTVLADQSTSKNPEGKTTIDYQLNLKVKDLGGEVPFLGQKVHSLKGNITVNPDSIYLEDVSGVLGEIPVKIKGRIYGFNNPALNLFVSSDEVPLEKLEKQFKFLKKVPLKGKVNLDVSFRGLASSPIIRGWANFDRVILRNETIQNGKLKFTYFSETINFQVEKASWENGFFKSWGYVNLEGRTPHFAVEMKGRNANVGKLARILFPEYEIQARSTFEVNVVGTMNDPLAFGQTDLYGFRYQVLNLDSVSSHFIFANNTVFLSDLVARRQGGVLRSPSILFDFKRNFVNGHLNARNFSLPTGLSPSLKDVRAATDLDAFLVGQANSPLICGLVDNGRIDYQGKIFKKTSGRFAFRKNVLVLSGFSTVHRNSLVNLDGWFSTGGRQSGQVSFSTRNLKLCNLDIINQNLSCINTRYPVDLSGYIMGKGGRFSWSATGEGPLGDLATFGDFQTGRVSGLKGALIGWNLQMDDFVPPDQKKMVKPGKSDTIMIASGPLSNLKIHFLLNSPGGRVLGLPVDLARGQVTYGNDRLKIKDTYVFGFASGKKVDRRIASLEDLYKTSVFWGSDVNSPPPDSLLAQMYLSPAILDNYYFNWEGWRVNTTAPVSLAGEGITRQRYFRVYGLPEVWKDSRIYQLKSYSDTGYPLAVSFERGKTGNEFLYSDKIKILQARVEGEVNLLAASMNLNLDGSRNNLGVIGRNLDLSSLGISMEQIHKALPLDSIEGDADFSGTLSGTWRFPRWEGSVDIKNGIINNTPFELSAQFSANPKQLGLSQLKLLQSGASYRGEGNIALDPEINLDLKLNTSNGELSRILAFTPWRDIPAKGDINGNIHLAGPPGKLLMNGDLSVSQAIIYSQPITNMEFSINSGPDSVELKRMEAQIGEGKITGMGTFRGKNLNFEFEAEDFPLSEIQFLKKRFPEISGNGKMEIVIDGKEDDPRLRANFAADDLVIRGNKIDRVQAVVGWEHNKLLLEPLTLKAMEKYWNLRGSITFPGGKIPTSRQGWVSKDNPPVLSMKTEFSNWKLEEVLQTFGHPMEDKLAGVLDGKVQIEGTLADPECRADISIDNGRIGKVPFSSIDAQIENVGEIIKIDHLEYKSDVYSASLTGNVNYSKKKVNLSVDINNLPTAVFHPFVRPIENLHGNINLNAKVWGSSETPNLNANLKLENGRMGNLKFDRAGGTITAKEGLVSFDNLAITKGKHQISFKGSVPLAFRKDKLVNTGPVDVTAQIREKSLDILGIFIPYLEKSSGRFQGELKVTGTYPNLEIKGQAEIKNGTVKMSVMENSVENLNSKVKFEGKNLKVDKLTGKLGNGKFSLVGFAHLDENSWEIDKMKFVLLGKNLLLKIPDLINGLVDTKVTLTGNLKQMVIGNTQFNEGEDYLRIYNATVSLPEGQIKDISQVFTGRQKDKNKKSDIYRDQAREQDDDSPAIPLPITTATRPFYIYLSDDVWLDFKGLFIRSEGGLKIYRLPERSVQLRGEVAFSRGTLNLPFLNNPFKISSGEAFFQGEEPINPNFKFQAETQVSNYDIYMSYEGTMEELQEAFKGNSTSRADISMYSIPPLSRSAILELLISNTFIGSLTPGEDTTGSTPPPTFQTTATSALAGYLQGILLTSLSRSLGRALALSNLHVDYSPYGALTVEISKALDPNERFFLTYSRIQRPQQEIRDLWGIEYKYRPGMRVRVESDQESLTYSLRGQITFDSFSEFFQELFRITTFRGRRHKKENNKGKDKKTDENK